MGQIVMRRRLTCTIAALLMLLTGYKIDAGLDVQDPVKIERAGTAAAAPTLEPVDLDSWLDGFMPNALRQADIAGAVVAVVKDGKILLQRGYGYADVQRHVPMDPERTVVGVGSISKIFTWTAVMQLVEQGRLDLNTDVNRYLDFKIPPAFGKPITLTHLMTHTAGFEQTSFIQLSPDAVARGLGEYLRGVPVPSRIYPPGAVPAYSNYGSMLAGYIVERASGETFVDYTDRHIFAPLGMKKSSFRRPVPQVLQTDLSQSYDVGSGEPFAPENEEPAGDPSGHLATTASDISRFMIAHLQQGQFEGVSLLKPGTANLMHRTASKPPPVTNGMALGFFVMERNGRRAIEHGGDISGFHSWLSLLPREKTGIFVGLNSSGRSEGAVSAANLLRLSLLHDFVDRYFPAGPRAVLPTTATAAAHAKLAAGQYWLSQVSAGDFMNALSLAVQFFVFDVEVKANEDGTIETSSMLSMIKGRPQTWREIAPFEWQEVDGDARLKMKIVNGEVVSFQKDDVVSAFILQRVPLSRSASLNMGLLLAAATITFLSVLFWPIIWFVRRRFESEHEFSRHELRLRRLNKISACTAVLYLVGWLFIFANSDQPGMLPWIRLVQAIGLICIFGLIIFAWSAWVGLKTKGPWWRKAWNVILALAMLEIIYFSFAFKLISIDMNY